MNQRPAFLLLAGIALFGACAAPQANLPAVADGEALFDHFEYRGNDTYYRENPLPDAESFYNPILPGWYSDPSFCTNGQGDYFLVTSTFCYFPGVPIFHSRDLVNWRQVGHVLSRESQLLNMPGQHVSGGIFAPAISYNPHNKTYYMVTTNVGYGNFYVKTTDPFGEWSDPIRLPEVGGIDPSFFFDDDGKAYIVNNDDAPDFKPEYDGHRTIRVQEFDWKNDRTVGPRKILVDKGVNPAEKPIWIEGPHLYKINGSYYLMDAEGGTGPRHSEVIFRSSKPMEGFKPWSGNPILTQRHLNPARTNPITCAGHADLLQTPEGDWWSVFLACRPIDGKFENLGRETFMMPVRWSNDRFPIITTGEEVVPMIAKRPGVKRAVPSTDGSSLADDPDFVQTGNFTHRDDFDATKLGMRWMTLRTAATDLYSLTRTPGYLALKCDSARSTERGTPALVARRMQHHEFEAETRMIFNPRTDGQSAGILLFKDETHQYFFCVSQAGGKRSVNLRQIGRGEDKLLATTVLTEGGQAFHLKVVSTGHAYRFDYSTDGGANYIALGREADASYLSTAIAGGFTGSVIALHAVRE